VTLGVAHLERLTNPTGRAIQMADLIAAIPTDGPAVIGGDFNTTSADLSRPRELARLAFRLLREPRRLQRPEAHEPLFEQLNRAGFTFEGANLPLVPTFTPATPVPRFIRPKLDGVATRGIRPLPDSARVVCATRSWGRRISDHDFIACDLEL
jgi:endonuclease/exonuclease/phosphatase family metal-dependent hydrolase